MRFVVVMILEVFCWTKTIFAIYFKILFRSTNMFSFQFIYMYVLELKNRTYLDRLSRYLLLL